MSGGVRVHISQIFRGLDPSSYTHHLITNASDSDLAYQSKPFCQQEVTSIPIVHGSPLTDIINLKRIHNIVRTGNFGIIHGHGTKGGLYARLLRGVTGSKVIYTPHGGSSHDQSRRAAKVIQSASETLLARATDAYIFESRYAQEQFIKIFGRHDKRFFVNHNGIHIGTMAPNLSTSGKPGRFIVGAFGRLESAKGFDLLIQAIHILLEAGFREVQCRIFGEGPSFKDLNDLINSLGISNHVTMMGYSKDVSGDMAGCDIVVHPSRFDSMPYVPLEAMRAGRAVIATGIGGLPELIFDHHNGLLAKPEPEDLARQIQLLLWNQQLRLKLAKNGFARIKQYFSIEAMLEKLDSIYQSLVD